MSWEKVSKEKCELLDGYLQTFSLQKKTMFGCPVYFANGYMFTGVHGDKIFLRLADDQQIAVKAQYPEACAFEPIKGRIMKDYITIPQTMYDDAAAFNVWLLQAFERVSSLPEKVKAAKGKK